MSTDAEAAVIGAIIKEPKYLSEIPWLSPDDFQHGKWCKAFAAIKELDAEGMVDGIAVAERSGVDRFDILEAQQHSDSWKAVQYARMVKDASERRNLKNIGMEIARLSSESETPLDEAQSLLATLEEGRVGRAQTLAEVLRERYPTLTTKRPYVGLADFPGIHLHLGDLCLIAARPAVGKSAFAAQLADEWTGRNLKVRVYSYEMDSGDWADRLLMRYTPYTTNEFDKGLTEEQAEGVKSLTKHLAERDNFEIINAARLSLPALFTDLRAFARRGGKVAIIDYLQLAISKGGKESRYEAVTEASRRLKVLASDTRLLIVALSQLNRGSVKDDGTLRPPTLGDLRESGALEQDADDVILLHAYSPRDTKVRDRLKERKYILEFDGESFPKTLGHIDFAKLRRGSTRVLPCWFDGEDQAWSVVDKEA